MTDPAPKPATRRWPLAPGEHPHYPRLHTELHPGQPALTGRGGRPIYPAHPPYARYQLDTTRVIITANPDRIRRHATELHALADALQAELEQTPADQLFPGAG